jgi:SAM-dependent methyltransferase
MPNHLTHPLSEPDCSASDDPTLRFYETRALEYAQATRRRAWVPLAMEFAQNIAGQVLDLGCGAGYDLELLASRNNRVVGLDYSMQMAAIARANSGLPVVVADMRAIPFCPDSFDGVWASASLLHLPRMDMAGALQEIVRVMKPGGRFLASLKMGRGDLTDGDGRSFKYYEREDWETRLTDAGFRSISLALNDGSKTDVQGNRERWMTSLAVVT